MIYLVRSFVASNFLSRACPTAGKLLLSFLDSAGNHLFEAVPMNWRAPDGTIPQYWVDHFRRLDAPIPEGLPGTNPTGLAGSALLKKE